MEAEPSSAKRRTLIVEDDRVSRTVLARILVELGHEVQTAATAAEGMQKLEWPPERLMLDLMLPDGTGISILEKIRNEHLPIKVLITTGTSDGALLAAAEGLHPDGLFRKPLQLPDVVRWLAKFDD